MTEKTLDELRAETDQLMHSPLHMHHEARLAALAAERNAADIEIERLTRERDEARAEVEKLRAVVQDLCEVLDECVYEIDTRYGPPGSNNIDRELIERAYAALEKARVRDNKHERMEE